MIFLQLDKGERFDVLISNFYKIETWTNPNRGFFWIATSSLWCNNYFWCQLDPHPYNLNNLNNLSSIFTSVKLDKSMRNSAEILKYADQFLNHEANWKNDDYKLDFSQFPEGIKPTVLEVYGTTRNNLHAYIATFEDALLEMRPYFHFKEEAEKRDPFRDNIVVFVPHFFRLNDHTVLSDVAKKLGFVTGFYLLQDEYCNYESLICKNGVLFTTKYVFQGCETKLLINFERPLDYVLKNHIEARIDQVDALLRCTTKLIVIKTLESNSPPLQLDWSILMRLTLISGLLINHMSSLQPLLPLLSCFFLLFSFTKFFQFPLFASFFSKSSWLSFSMSLVVGNLVSLKCSESLLMISLSQLILFICLFLSLSFLTLFLFWGLADYTITSSFSSSISHPMASFYVRLFNQSVILASFLYLFLYLSTFFFSDYLFQIFFPSESLLIAVASLCSLCLHPYLPAWIDFLNSRRVTVLFLTLASSCLSLNLLLKIFNEYQFCCVSFYLLNIFIFVSHIVPFILEMGM
jgi:hypothetical protein